jgi:hypothetical protein
MAMAVSVGFGHAPAHGGYCKVVTSRSSIALQLGDSLPFETVESYDHVKHAWLGRYVG